MNYFSDLYIEENEKFDAIITMFKLAGWEYTYDEMNENREFHGFYKGLKWIEIIVEKGERLKLDYVLQKENGKMDSCGGDDINLMLERLIDMI